MQNPPTIRVYEVPVAAQIKYHRRGDYRALREHVAMLAGRMVGRLITIAEGEYRGLVAWVRVEFHSRGRGIGRELHRLVQEQLGYPLLLDVCGAAETGDASDNVADAEMRMLDNMICSPLWYCMFRPDGIVSAEVRA